MTVSLFMVAWCKLVYIWLCWHTNYLVPISNDKFSSLLVERGKESF